VIDFQPSISLGTVIHLVALLATVVGLWWKIGEKITNSFREVSERLARLETKVDALWREYTKNGR
jgi:tetrahydromethanopterin S-methyltransferase subunit B